MITIFRQIKFYQKIAKTRVVKILITIPLTPEIMQQLTIKPARRSLAQGSRKNQKFKNIQIFKIADDFSLKKLLEL